MIYDNKFTVKSFITKDYKTKEFKRKTIKPFCYLTKHGFSEYSKKHKVMVCGDICVNQKSYNDIITSNTPDKTLIKKSKKHINGYVQLETVDAHDNSVGITSYKKFDLYERLRFRTCIGYAHVGDNNFIRLCRYSFLPLIIILLFALLFSLIMLMNNCQKPLIPDSAISNNTENSETIQNSQYELCYFEPLSATTYINEDNPCLHLKNVSENAGNYYINYEIYINGELQYLVIEDNIYYISDNGRTDTGLIQPGYSVSINLYQTLEAGTYDLTCKASEYAYSDKEQMLPTYNLTTTLIVDK